MARPAYTAEAAGRRPHDSAHCYYWEVTSPDGKKKPLSGCVVALLIVGGVLFVCFVGIGAVLIHAARSPSGERVVKVVEDTAAAMYKAQNAPGAKAVWKAGNCDQAYVINSEDIAKIGSDFNDGGQASPEDISSLPALVTCQVGLFWSPPTCDLLATTYVNAAHPTGPFQVEVRKLGELRPICTTLYESDGTRVRRP